MAHPLLIFGITNGELDPLLAINFKSFNVDCVNRAGSGARIQLGAQNNLGPNHPYPLFPPENA